MTLPKHIMNYHVSSKSPTEELMILGRLLSEVGSYASTTLDSVHLRLAKSCYSRLEKVLAQLVKRGAIEDKEDLYDFSCQDKEILAEISQLPNFPFMELKGLSISELELLYRAKQGFDKSMAPAKSQKISTSRYSEFEIVRELEKREPVYMADQLKIDYCTLTFQNELDYLSFLLNAPIGNSSKYVPMDRALSYSPDELVALLRLYSGCYGFKSVFQQLTLEQYADYAIEYVDNSSDIKSVAMLIEEIARQNSSDSILCRPWLSKKLKEIVEPWEKNPSMTDLYMVSILNAMHCVSKGWDYERKAKKILVAAYKTALVPQESIDTDIDYICTVVEHLGLSFPCSVRKLVTRWIEVCRQVIDFDMRLSSSQITRLLDAADNMRYYKPIPSEIEEALLSRLSVLAETGDLIAQIYFQKNRIVEDETADSKPYEPKYVPLVFGSLQFATH